MFCVKFFVFDVKFLWFSIKFYIFFVWCKIYLNLVLFASASEREGKISPPSFHVTRASLIYLVEELFILLPN